MNHEWGPAASGLVHGGDVRLTTRVAGYSLSCAVCSTAESLPTSRPSRPSVSPCRQREICAIAAMRYPAACQARAFPATSTSVFTLMIGSTTANLTRGETAWDRYAAELRAPITTTSWRWTVGRVGSRGVGATACRQPEERIRPTRRHFRSESPWRIRPVAALVRRIGKSGNYPPHRGEIERSRRDDATSRSSPARATSQAARAGTVHRA